jgi:hypothetical protein
MSGSMDQIMLERLEHDSKYQQVLSSISDADVRKHIDLTTRAFVVEIARGLDEVRRALGDDAARKELQKLLEQRVKRGK